MTDRPITYAEVRNAIIEAADRQDASAALEEPGSDARDRKERKARALRLALQRIDEMHPDRGARA
jgi:hypothetical protein